MTGFDPRQIEKWSRGSWKPAAPRKRLAGFSNDTRQLEEGDVFVAIRTDKRDGHDFLDAAEDAGASAALTQREVSGSALPQLVVEDSLHALQEIALNYRKSFGGKVIGITGSCGKTTVKELLAHLLSGSRRTHATEKNLNNLLGVPLTLLKADAQESEYVIVEAGISERGEMERLGRMIQPDVAIFTAIGEAHLEGLGSLEGIAAEKGKLARSENTKVAYLGGTCEPYSEALFQGESVRVRKDEALQTVFSYRSRFEGGQTVLEIRGRESIERYEFRGASEALSANVALAIAVCRDQGLAQAELNERLSVWERAGMRGEWLERGGSRVFVDCYNANPLSMRDSLSSFLMTSADASPRLFIVGSMEELGAASAGLHEELGASLRPRANDRVVLVGSYAADMRRGMERAGNDVSNTSLLADISEAGEALSGFVGSVFLKGSRKYRLERVLDFLGQRGEKAEC